MTLQEAIERIMRRIEEQEPRSFEEIIAELRRQLEAIDPATVGLILNERFIRDFRAGMQAIIANFDKFIAALAEGGRPAA